MANNDMQEKCANQRLNIILKWSYRLLATMLLGAAVIMVIYYGFTGKHTISPEATVSIILLGLGGLSWNGVKSHNDIKHDKATFKEQ